MRYVREMGLNTIRQEGKLEPDAFYDRADELGILIMPIWGPVMRSAEGTGKTELRLKNLIDYLERIQVSPGS